MSVSGGGEALVGAAFVIHNHHMLLTRRERPILIANLAYVPPFTLVSLLDLNFEFVLYVGVILLVGGLILWKQQTIRFDRGILWGLTIWGFLHLAGGNIPVGESVLYNLTLAPVLPEPYHVLRYDQVVHVFGFGVATLVCHHLLTPYLRDEIPRWRTLAILVVLMGSGVGAINEIIEFIVTVAVPDTNVGGYENMAIDLVCNLLGGTLAVGFLTLRHKRRRLVTAGP